MTSAVLRFVCETLFHSKMSAKSLVLKLSRYTSDRDSKWSATTIGDVHTVMPHVELSFVREDVQVESEATSQDGELETLHYVKQELGGGS